MKVLFFGSFIFSIWYLSTDAISTIDVITKYGYNGETHYVTTEDAYILTIHRILVKNPSGDGFVKETKPAVLLVHGLMSSSFDYVNLGPDRSLAFLLSDAGYDVWIVNTRGNSYSRNHTALNPDVKEDQEDFFDFGWHEVGYYDIASSIDYILETNREQSLYYIGHSQAAAALFVLTSIKPEYNEKIRIASLMAPAVFMEHHTVGLVPTLCKHIKLVEDFLKQLRIFEVPFVKEIRFWLTENCGQTKYEELCQSLLFMVAGGPNENQLDQSALENIGSNFPSNTGIKQFLHFGQLVKSGGFLYYDYGPSNLEIYGSSSPPSYNLSKVTVPIALYYSKNDQIVTVKDTENLIAKLTTVANDYLVPYEDFNHIDFLFAKDVIPLVYDELLNVMRDY